MGGVSSESGADRALDPAARLVMLSGGLLAALALTAINSVLPRIDEELGGTPTASLMVKQLIGGVGLAMVFGSAISGFLVDRMGLRRVIIFASVVYAIAGTAGLYLNSLSWLLASRLLLGLAAACIQVSSLAFINRQLQGRQRARWMGLHISVAMFGTILVHPIAGLLGEMGWRYPFALYGLGAVLALAMSVCRLDDELPKTDHGQLHGGWRRVVNGLKTFPLHYLALAFLVGSLVFLPNVYLPFILRDLGATPALIAYVLTAESITGCIVALGYGFARRYVSHRGAFMISFACVAAGNLVALTHTTLIGVIGGMLIFGLGTGWLVANVMTALGSKVPSERQGQAAGFVKAAHFLSGPITIVAIEPIARAYGPTSALLMVAAVAGVLLTAMGLRMAQQYWHSPERQTGGLAGKSEKMSRRQQEV